MCMYSNNSSPKVSMLPEKVFFILESCFQFDFIFDIDLTAAFHDVVTFPKEEFMVIENGENISFVASVHQVRFCEHACKTRDTEKQIYFTMRTSCSTVKVVVYHLLCLTLIVLTS